MNEKILDFIARGAGIVLGIIFLVAAALKGTDIIRFQRQIELLLESFSLPPIDALAISATVLAVLIIFAEFAIGSMLILNYKPRPASIAALFLLIPFSVVIIRVIVTNTATDCGCFGVWLERSPLAALIEDAFMIGLSILSLFSHRPSVEEYKRWVPAIIVTGCLWTAVLYTFPPAWAAMKPGMELSFASYERNPDEPRLYWFFDPNCYECQSQVHHLNQIAAAGYEITALTASSPAHITEFRLDFEPQFIIARIDSRWTKWSGLRLGNLLAIEKRKIIRVWHPQRLPEISELDKEYAE